MTFRKDDAGKPPLHLLPPVSLIRTAECLAIGAGKYGGHNWMQGAEWSRYYDALLRHALAFWSGTERDSEGNDMLAAVAANALILLAMREMGIGTDDRPQTVENGRPARRPRTTPATPSSR